MKDQGCSMRTSSKTSTGASFSHQCHQYCAAWQRLNAFQQRRTSQAQEFKKGVTDLLACP